MNVSIVSTTDFNVMNKIILTFTLRDAYSWHLDSHLDLVTYF